MTPLAPPSSSSYPPGDQPQFAEPRGADNPNPAQAVIVGGQSNGQIPVWNAATGRWEPGTPSAGLPGAWEPIGAGLSAKVELDAAVQVLAARLESAGATARLRGAILIKAAQEVNAGETLFTIPAGFRPLGTVKWPEALTVGPSTITVTITPGGLVSSTILLKAGAEVYFDGVTYNVT